MKTIHNFTSIQCRAILSLCIALITTSSLGAQNRIHMFLQADSLESSNKLHEAEHLLEQLSYDNHTNAAYYYSLGKLYHQKGAYKKSTSAFIRAQELGVYYRSNYFLACNYLNSGQPDSAIYYLSAHLTTPLNGDHPFNDDVLSDSVFLELRTRPEYISLLPPRIADTSQVSKNWITDINYLSSNLKKIHFNPFFKISETAWDQEIGQLIDDIPLLNNDQIYVRIAQFVAMMGDGHTRILPMGYHLSKFKKLPISTRLFSDGCYIIAASKEYEDLLGAKITGVGNMNFDSVYNLLSTVLSVDNDMGYRFLFDWEFNKMNVLHGLGISKSVDQLEIEYTINGKTSRRNLLADYEEGYPELISYHQHFNKVYPIFLENYRKSNIKWYWFKYLEDSQILYFQLNGITSIDDEPLPEFCNRIKAMVETSSISAFVLDIRNNGGGNTELNKYILELLLSEKINIRGKLFTVIGPNTFSAAQNLTSVIENYTETIFIGEPTGSKPHFIGEVNPVELPYSGMLISVSNVFHQHGYSTDTRTWIAPDIYVDFSFNDFNEGKDPVISEIREYLLFR